jgi:hypothetical protein
MSNEVEIENDKKVLIISDEGRSITLDINSTNSITVSNQGVQGIQGVEGSAIWGNVAGTLSDQSDLQAALDSKLTKEDSDIIRQAGSGNNTLSYIADVLDSITYSDTATITNNTKSLTYTSEVLTGISHVFDYDGQTWTVTTTLTYTGSSLTGKTITVNKV